MGAPVGSWPSCREGEGCSFLPGEDTLRVLVVGGTGFLGQRVVRAIRAIPEAEVWVASRRARGDRARSLDLSQPGSFDSVRDFQYVVNCADTTRASPLPLIQYCARNAIPFLETSADPDALETVWRWGRDAGDELRSAVILGVGRSVFPWTRWTKFSASTSSGWIV